ncbi:hypothetical protein [Streptomyces sp. NPDC059063]|uniref:hypothetical protein n=1 Tax=unclassified Streptomyces TaxID=2593676 RepID=UPI00369AC298
MIVLIKIDPILMSSLGGVALSDMIDSSAPAEAGMGPSAAALGNASSAEDAAAASPMEPEIPLTYDELLADRDKWQREAEQFQTAKETTAEETLKNARAEVNREVIHRMVRAELCAHALNEGLSLSDIPKSKYLKMDSFLGDDGYPSSDHIKSFIDSLSGQKRPKFPQLGNEVAPSPAPTSGLNGYRRPYPAGISLDTRSR